MANLLLDIIKPYTIPLLKEMHETHIVKLDNWYLLGMHKHRCCLLQKSTPKPK